MANKIEKYEFEVWTLAYELEHSNANAERARAAAGEAVKAYRETRAAWVSRSERLPNSDDLVLVANSVGDYVLARLEITDDSEPYWMARGVDLTLEDYPYWMPLPASPQGA